MENAQVRYLVTGYIAHLVLNNPERFNVIGPRMATDLVDTLRATAANQQVRAVLRIGPAHASYWIRQ